jgi:NADH-quinone oxidoreductase subunit J
MEAVIFYVLATITVVSALCVVLLRRPIHNILFMILTMMGLAALYILLYAEFVAMVQLVVYAGAVMVLFLFVIMLLNLEQMPFIDDPRSARWWGGICLAVALIVLLLPAIKAFSPKTGGPTALGAGGGLSNTQVIASELFTTYLLPFEVASVLLLAAIVGAVLLARRKP